MIDYTKPQPCGECGKMVRLKEKHIYQDCLKWKDRLRRLSDNVYRHYRRKNATE